jgi:hypothetical protein
LERCAALESLDVQHTDVEPAVLCTLRHQCRSLRCLLHVKVPRTRASPYIVE